MHRYFPGALVPSDPDCIWRSLTSVLSAQWDILNGRYSHPGAASSQAGQYLDEICKCLHGARASETATHLMLFCSCELPCAHHLNDLLMLCSGLKRPASAGNAKAASFSCRPVCFLQNHREVLPQVAHFLRVMFMQAQVIQFWGCTKSLSMLTLYMLTGQPDTCLVNFL